MNGNLIAVSDKAQAHLFGAVTYWNGSVVEIPLNKFADALSAAGFGPDTIGLPALPGPEAALSRAVKSSKTVRDGYKRFTRYTKSAWYVVDEVTGMDGEPTWSAGLKVSVNAVGRLSFAPAGHHLCQSIEDAWSAAMESVTGQDVSRWLCIVAKDHAAVTLRDNGGMYFIPRHMLAKWRAIAAVVRACCGFKVYEIPAAETGDEAVSSIVEAVTDALMADSQKEIDEINQRVFAPEEDQRKLGARAIKGRISRADALAERVAMYEGLLGAKLTMISEKLESLRGSLCVAMLTADPTEVAPTAPSIAA